VLNILCKVTGNGLRHTRLLDQRIWKAPAALSIFFVLDDDQPACQDLVNTAIDQFSKRLTLVIRAQGGHIEHRLN